MTRGSRAGCIAFVVALVLVLGLVVAFFIHVELVARPEYERIMNTPQTLPPGRAGVDDPRWRHCAELRRLSSAWFSYGPAGARVWDEIDERYTRECPDHGMYLRPDIQWSPSLPPEPPPS